MQREQVAGQAGFGTALSLRQHFSNQIQISPSSYRKVFRAKATVADQLGSAASLIPASGNRTQYLSSNDLAFGHICHTIRCIDIHREKYRAVRMLHPKRCCASGGRVAIADLLHPLLFLRQTNLLRETLIHPNGRVAHRGAQVLVLIPRWIATLLLVPDNHVKLVFNHLGLQGKQGVGNFECGRWRKALLGTLGLVDPKLERERASLRPGENPPFLSPYSVEAM